MSEKNKYYDSNIYAQSTNMIIKVAYMYYYKKMRQQEISERLEISVPTVSRMLRKAKEKEIVHFVIDADYLECLDLEEKIGGYYPIREVIVAPLPGEEERSKDADAVKKVVGLEGARYIQRVVTDRDVLGVAYGETVWYVYNFLNPSQRKDMGFVTLHGNLRHKDNKLDGSWLVPRIAKAFGGKSYTLKCRGIQKSRDAVMAAFREPDVHRVYDQFPRITISISGVGMIYPEKSSVLVRGDYLTQDEIDELESAGVCGDIMFRFFDQKGKECDTSMRSKVVGIPLEHYRRIPNKVIVASGAEKAIAVRALLVGKLVDTLIIDQALGRELERLCERYL